MKQCEVLCVGIACVDVLLKGADFSTPFEAESKHANSVHLAVGGDAANEAIVLSRLGHHTQLMCGLGQDAIGRLISSEITAAGVDVSGVVESTHSGSPINVIVIHPNGQRNFINSGVPQAACFVPDAARLGDAKIVSLGSLLLPPFHDPVVTLATVKAAKAAGATVCADVVVGPGDSLGKIAPVLAYLDYIFPNLEEARQLTGEQEVEQVANVLLAHGVKTVVIKTGKDGCFVKNATLAQQIPAYASAEVVDTTGAGDNFAAGFLSGLLQGFDLVACCRYACGVASVSIGSYGASTGVKSRRQVEDAIARFEKGGA